MLEVKENKIFIYKYKYCKACSIFGEISSCKNYYTMTWMETKSF